MKKNRKLRICIKFRDLNNATLKDDIFNFKTYCGKFYGW